MRSVKLIASNATFNGLFISVRASSVALLGFVSIAVATFTMSLYSTVFLIVSTTGSTSVENAMRIRYRSSSNNSGGLIKYSANILEIELWYSLSGTLLSGTSNFSSIFFSLKQIKYTAITITRARTNNDEYTSMARTIIKW